MSLHSEICETNDDKNVLQGPMGCAYTKQIAGLSFMLSLKVKQHGTKVPNQSHIMSEKVLTRVKKFSHVIFIFYALAVSQNMNIMSGKFQKKFQ